MGLVLGLIIIGYIAICGVVLAVVSRISARKGLFVSITLLVMAWPIWFPLLSWLLFEVNCQFGSPGLHQLKPFKIDSFAIGNASPFSGIYQTRDWKGSNNFLSECDDYCIEEINNLFQERAPWSKIRNSGVAVEKSWFFYDKNISKRQQNRKTRHGKFWTAPSDSNQCLAPLLNEQREIHPFKCIAGIEIPAISATYIFQIYPFPYNTDNNYLTKRQKEMLKWHTSKKWEFFYVAKYEHQLLNNNEIVAKYVWYEWDFIPFFGLEDSYPIRKNPGNNVYEDFFKLVLTDHT